ncbi:hypothetical protein BH18ACI4_BH18ACI4_06580 [soil metagenome]
MGPVRAKAFIKSRTCPSAEDISRHSLPRTESDRITRHIDGCDFCAAEQCFLSAYLQTLEEYEPAEMPAHRRRLAEALLFGKLKGSCKGKVYGGRRLLQEPGFAFEINLRARDAVG